MTARELRIYFTSDASKWFHFQSHLSQNSRDFILISPYPLHCMLATCKKGFRKDFLLVIRFNVLISVLVSVLVTFLTVFVSTFTNINPFGVFCRLRVKSFGFMIKCYSQRNIFSCQDTIP